MADLRIVGSSQAPDSDIRDRLDSWKEIAAYLDRGVRTVQRWEREDGLPVHRLPHEKRATVYAFRREIDDWWIRRASEIEKGETAQSSSILPKICLLLALILGLVWLLQMFGPPGPSEDKDRRSIAVLSLTHLSPDTEDEYLADGITEDITTSLSTIGDLKVIGPTSARRYKNSTKTPQKIAAELDVATLMYVSLRRVKDRIRIGARLIDAETEEQLWAETYDRDLRDVFGVQSEVAQEIAITLKQELSPEEEERLTHEPPANLEAFNLVLKGRYFRNIETSESLLKSITCYRQAIKLDPDYALAHAGLADALRIFPVWGNPIVLGFKRPEELEAAVTRSVDTALELDNSLAEVHVMRGIIRRLYNNDPSGAVEDFSRALQLNPNDSNAHREYGLHLRTMGRLNQALDELNAAVSNDPLSALALAGLATVHVARGEFVLAAETIGRKHELAESSGLEPVLAGIYVALGEYDRTEEIAWGHLQWFAPHGQTGGLSQHRKQEIRDSVEWSMEVIPEHSETCYSAGLLANLDGDNEYARSCFQKAMQLSHWYLGDHADQVTRLFLANILEEEGRDDEAQKLLSDAFSELEQSLELGDQRPFVPFLIAAIRASQGNTPEACRWLKGAIEGGWWSIDTIRENPGFQKIEDEACYQRIMAELRASVDEVSERIHEIEREYGRTQFGDGPAS